MFNYRLLQWFCTCGVATRAVNVGITSDYKLIAKWQCKCGKEVFATETFENLIANAPPTPATLTQSDEAWLAKAKIRV